MACNFIILGATITFNSVVEANGLASVSATWHTNNPATTRLTVIGYNPYYDERLGMMHFAVVENLPTDLNITVDIISEETPGGCSESIRINYKTAAGASAAGPTIPEIPTAPTTPQQLPVVSDYRTEFGVTYTGDYYVIFKWTCDQPISYTLTLDCMDCGAPWSDTDTGSYPVAGTMQSKRFFPLEIGKIYQSFINIKNSSNLPPLYPFLGNSVSDVPEYGFIYATSQLNENSRPQVYELTAVPVGYAGNYGIRVDYRTDIPGTTSITVVEKSTGDVAATYTLAAYDTRHYHYFYNLYPGREYRVYVSSESSFAVPCFCQGAPIVNPTTITPTVTLYTYTTENGIVLYRPSPTTTNMNVGCSVDVTTWSRPSIEYTKPTLPPLPISSNIQMIPRIISYYQEGNNYISVSGIIDSGYSKYDMEIRDSLFNSIPYNSTYVDSGYRLTPTGPLSNSGVSFVIAWSGFVLAKKTMSYGVVPGTHIIIV